MKKVNKCLIYILLPLVAIVFFAVFNHKTINVLAENTSKNISKESKIYCNATIEDSFDEDSVIVVLSSSISQYSGINEFFMQKLEGLEVEKIDDLTALPIEYLESKTKINEKKAPSLVEHYSKIVFNQILHVQFKQKSKKNVLQLIKIIEEFDEVISVEPDWLYESTTEVAVDPMLSTQWALNNSQGISAIKAWPIVECDTDIRVGVIDSGVAEHDDLQIVEGKDFYNNNNVTNDDIDIHGTCVAGIIGAIGNNGIGVSGVSQNITIVPLQTINTGTLLHSASDRNSAIQYATSLWDTEQRISILNHSIGGYGTNTSLLYQIKLFPGLFVWSAGNSGDNVDLYENIDRFDVPNLISVGAIDKYNERSIWNSSQSSCYGEKVDIFAPGGKGPYQNDENIITVGVLNDYRYFNGTSAAAPHVTGVAALILSQDPTMTASEIKELILNSAETITISTPSGNQTVKKLNAFNALNEMQFTTSEINGTDDVAVTGISTNLTEITVPETIGGKTVTKIGESAFYHQALITEVELPTTVTEIGNHAFNTCMGLETITGLDNVQTIGAFAFSACFALEEVILPSSLTSIGAGAFSGCSSLAEITIPTGLTSIWNSTFSGCSSLTEITIPAGLTHIGLGAFSGCYDMDITVSPNNTSYTAVGNIVYNKAMTKLLFVGKIGANVTIPATVTEVESNAMRGNSDISRLYFESSPLIKDGAFAETGLDFVYFYGITVPTFGLNVLPDNDFLAYVPYNTQNAYRSALSGYTDSFALMPITVTCYIDGFTMENINTYYGATITYLPEPQKLGLAFMGWYDNMTYAGEAYETGEIWMAKQALTLWAKWVAIVPPTSLGGGGYTTLTWQQLQALVPKREEVTV